MYPCKSNWTDIIEDYTSDYCDDDTVDWAVDENDDVLIHGKAGENGDTRIHNSDFIDTRAPGDINAPVPIAIPVRGVDGGLQEAMRRDRDRDRDRDRINAEEQDRLPQQLDLNAQRGVRAAIRWALRGRHPDHNFFNGVAGGGGGGGGEEIDQTDGVLDGEITGGMLDAEMTRARELINEPDRRTRTEEGAARRGHGESVARGAVDWNGKTKKEQT